VKHRGERGTALIEALAALTLLAIAGAVVASAASANLRAVRSGAVRGRLLAIAARELADLQTQPAIEGTHTAPLGDEAGIRGDVTRTTAIDSTAHLANLTVTVEAGPPRQVVTLATRRSLPW
jgi:hypothetical protein